MKRMVTVLLLGALLFASAGCAPATAAALDNGKLNVVATNFPGYDFVRQVAGERVNLTLLLPPGAESHSFEPTPQDILLVQSCDLFVCVGGESETWVKGILESAETSCTVLSMMELVTVVEEELKEGMEGAGDHDHAPGEEHSPYDEHVWTSPVNAMAIVEGIADALTGLDGDSAGAYRESAGSYCKQLEALDASFRQTVEAGERRTLIFGDRFPFRYFVEEYGLEYYAAFPGCATQTEPSARTVTFLIEKVEREQIPVVLYIELSNEKMADTVCEETGAEKRLFHSGHNLTKTDFESGVTYLDLMEGNLRVLKEALGEWR